MLGVRPVFCQGCPLGSLPRGLDRKPANSLNLNQIAEGWPFLARFPASCRQLLDSGQVSGSRTSLVDQKCYLCAWQKCYPCARSAHQSWDKLSACPAPRQKQPPQSPNHPTKKDNYSFIINHLETHPAPSSRPVLPRRRKSADCRLFSHSRTFTTTRPSTPYSKKRENYQTNPRPSQPKSYKQLTTAKTSPLDGILTRRGARFSVPCRHSWRHPPQNHPTPTNSPTAAMNPRIHINQPLHQTKNNTNSQTSNRLFANNHLVPPVTLLTKTSRW